MKIIRNGVFTMNIKKSLAIVTLSGVLFGAGFYSNALSEVNVKADTTEQSRDQGKIIVHYVDQNGNPIRPETVATGATGTTYVASVPQIKGYTYSSIENGQNNANGPQMVFGGGDPVTGVMSMTIVYNATSNKSADTNKNSNNSSSSNSNSDSNSSTADTPASNNKNSTSNKPSSESSSNKNSSTSKVKPNSTTSKKQNASNSNDNSADDSDSKDQPAKTTKAKKNADKKAKNQKNDDSTKKNQKSEATKDNHHLAWIIGGVILAIVVVGVGVWAFVKKPRSDRH